jgi:hypothetical protein
MMIRLNPVQDDKDHVECGLFLVDDDLYNMLKQQKFKEILLTNVTTIDGEHDVAKYFKVEKKWDTLLDMWNAEKKDVVGFERYYELLFLVKSESEVDHVWFSFVEGMHCHEAIITGLVCSKFNHLTNELQPGSLTLEDFRNGNIKSFKEPNTSVSDHLNQIMSKSFDAPMVHNQFHLSAYVPNQTMTAADLIDATQCQSLWISNYKRTLANTTISKVLANWLEQTLHHSTKDMR